MAWSRCRRSYNLWSAKNGICNLGPCINCNFNLLICLSYVSFHVSSHVFLWNFILLHVYFHVKFFEARGYAQSGITNSAIITRLFPKTFWRTHFALSCGTDLPRGRRYILRVVLYHAPFLRLRSFNNNIYIISRYILFI